MVLLFTFLLGGVCGLRSMTAPAVVAWGARLGWLHLVHSFLAFLAGKISLVVFSVFAIGELVADKLPFIPRRTQTGPLVVRIVFGAICGAALSISAASSPLAGAILGGAGGIAGAFAGYYYRRSLGGKFPDILLALLEDVVAVGGGFLLVSRF
ncbi:MAG TPA: DUF4126 family protein [Acidobacteriaceae bacterium]|nr:DUF4126 family protein [Acidobacteriaceae bacterium]